MYMQSCPPCGIGNRNKLNYRLNNLKEVLNTCIEPSSAKVNSIKSTIARESSRLAHTLPQVLYLVREVFQQDINDEIKQLFDRHIRTTFSPAFENLRKNGHTITEECVNRMFIDALEAAKNVFRPKNTHSKPKMCVSSQTMLELYETNERLEHAGESILSAQEHVLSNRHLQQGLKRTHPSDDDGSDGSDDNDTDKNNGLLPKKRGRPRKLDVDTGRCGTPIFHGTQPITAIEAEKYNPKRIYPSTKFVLYSKARKIIGKGRRDYVFQKNPRIFRYNADEFDKKWLFSQSCSTRLQGKVLVMILDDVEQMAEEENLSHSDIHEIKQSSFRLPPIILKKMCASMIEPYNALKSRVVDKPS